MKLEELQIAFFQAHISEPYENRTRQLPKYPKIFQISHYWDKKKALLNPSLL